jgi:hypothetical protein
LRAAEKRNVDAAFIALILVLFITTAGLVAAFERLRRSTRP